MRGDGVTLLTWKRGKALKAQLARIAPDGDVEIEVIRDRRAMFPQLRRLDSVSAETYQATRAALQRTGRRKVSA